MARSGRQPTAKITTGCESAGRVDCRSPESWLTGAPAAQDSLSFPALSRGERGREAQREREREALGRAPQSRPIKRIWLYALILAVRWKKQTGRERGGRAGATDTHHYLHPSVIEFVSALVLCFLHLVHKPDSSLSGRRKKKKKKRLWRG